MIRIISTITFMLFLTSCSTYKMEVQQGNALTNDVIAQLQTGMSKDEVMSILGTPLLQDNFRSDRWDYVYYTKQGNSSSKRQGITLLFKGNSLVRVFK